MPDEKFAPPPSNIVIRTMEKDIEALKQGGGELPQAPIPEEAAAGEPTDAFLYQQTPPSSTREPSVPAPPPIESAHSAAPSIGGPEMSSGGGKKFLKKPLLFAIAGIAGLLILGAAGYFVIFPIVKNAFFPAEPSPYPSPATPSPSPSPPEEPSPSPSPTPPTVSLVTPADEMLEVTVVTPTREVLANAFFQLATVENATGTFKLIAVKQSETAYLGSTAIFPLLWQNVPPAISSALGDTYALFLYWVKPREAHLGAYFALKPEASDAVAAALLEWEPTLAQDAAFFFLGKAPGAQSSFRAASYKNVNLRFNTFASGLAIDHAVSRNILIFTTHRDSMFEAITRLTGVE